MTNKIHFCLGKSDLENYTYFTNFVKINVEKIDFVSFNDLLLVLNQLSFFGSNQNNYFIENFNLKPTEFNLLQDFVTKYENPNLLYFSVLVSDDKAKTFSKKKATSSYKTLGEFIEATYPNLCIKVSKFYSNNKKELLQTKLKEFNLDYLLRQNDLDEIASIFPDDYIRFNQEIDKLIYLQNERNVSFIDLKHLIYKEQDHNLFNLSEQILLKNYQAFYSWSLQNHEDKEYLWLINTLANNLYELIKYKALSQYQPDAIGQAFFNQWWKIKKIKGMECIYNLLTLIKINNSLLKLDYDYKHSQVVDLPNAFKWLILNWKDWK